MRKSNFLLICEIICLIFLLIFVAFNIFILTILFFIPTVIYGLWAIIEYEKEEKRVNKNETKST